MELSKNICRMCLLDEDVTQLLDWNSNVYEGLTYLDCYRRCAQLKRTDDDGNDATCSLHAFDEIPLNCICLNCAQQLKEAYHFITKAHVADKMLRSRLSEKRLNCDNHGFIHLEDTCFPKCQGTINISKLSSNKMDCDSMLSTSNQMLPHDAELAHNMNDSPICSSTAEKENKPEESFRPPSPKPLKSILKKSRSESQHELMIGMEVCKIINSTVSKRSSCSLVKQSSQSNRGEFKQHSCGHVKHNHEPKRKMSAVRSVLSATRLQGQYAIDNIAEPRSELLVTSELCGRELYSKYTYTYHVKVHNKNCEALFRCDKCNRSFYHQLSLNLHRQEHTKTVFKCEMCHKRFKRSIDLEVHRINHSGEFPHKCELCGRAFRQKSTLNRHMQRHINVPFYCDTCGKEFLTYDKCQQHQLTHTDMAYKCVVCDKEYPDIHKMRRHIKIVHKVIDINEMNEFIINLKLP